MVGNISLPSGSTVEMTDAFQAHVKKAHLNYLDINSQFILYPQDFGKLRNYTKYSEVRLFCHKPSHNRTVDVAITVDEEIFNYLLNEKSHFNYCDKSYRRLSADNSLVSRASCSSLLAKKWGVGMRGKLFTSSTDENGIVVEGDNQSAFYCDDASNSSGVWKYYVR